ncbi:hypothetical protein K8R43_05670 [archaeon]|nr:hypothetical protein [archaeon]
MKNKFLLSLILALLFSAPVLASYLAVNTGQACRIGTFLQLTGSVHYDNHTGISSVPMNLTFDYSNGSIAENHNTTTQSDGHFNFTTVINCSDYSSQLGMHDWNVTANASGTLINKDGSVQVTKIGAVNVTDINGTGIFSPGDGVRVISQVAWHNGTALGSTSIAYSVFKANGGQIASGTDTTASNGTVFVDFTIPSNASEGLYFVNIGNATTTQASFIVKSLDLWIDLKNQNHIHTDTFSITDNMTIHLTTTSVSTGAPINGIYSLSFYYNNGSQYHSIGSGYAISGYDYKTLTLSSYFSSGNEGQYLLRVAMTTSTNNTVVMEIPLKIQNYDLNIRPYVESETYLEWGKYRGFGRNQTVLMIIELLDLENGTVKNTSEFYCNSTHIPNVYVEAMNGNVMVNNSSIHRHLVTDMFGDQHCTINFTADLESGKYKVVVEENYTDTNLTSNGRVSIHHILLTGGSQGDDFKFKALFVPDQEFSLKLNAYNASSGTDITSSITTANIVKMFHENGTELNASAYVKTPFSNGNIIMQAPSTVGVYSLKINGLVGGMNVTGDAMFIVKNFMVFGGGPPVNTDVTNFTVYAEAFDMDFNELSGVTIGIQSVVNEIDNKNWTNCFNTSLSGRTSGNGPAMVPIVKTCQEDFTIGFYEVIFWAQRTVTVGNTSTVINETGFGGFPVLNYWVNVIPEKEVIDPNSNMTFNISVVRINMSADFDPMFEEEGIKGDTLPDFIAMPIAVSAFKPGMEEDMNLIDLINPPNCTTTNISDPPNTTYMCQVTLNKSHFPDNKIPTGFLDLEVLAYNTSDTSMQAFGFGFFESFPYKIKIISMLWEGEQVFDPMDNPLIEGGNVSLKIQAFKELYKGGNMSEGFTGTPYNISINNVSFKAIRDDWTWQETGIIPTVATLTNISVPNGTYWLNFTVPEGLPGKGEYIIEMEANDTNGSKSPFDLFTVITPFGYTIAPAKVIQAGNLDYEANGTEEWEECGGRMNDTTIEKINVTGVSSASGKYKGRQVNFSGVLVDFILVDNNSNAPGKYRTVLARDHNMSSNFTIVEMGDNISSNAFIYFWEMKEKSESEFWVVSNETVNTDVFDCHQYWCVPWFGQHPVDTNFTLPLKLYGLDNIPLQANISIYKVLSGWTWPPINKTSSITTNAKYPNYVSTNAAGLAFLTVSANDTGHYSPLFNITRPGKTPEMADMETSWKFDFEIKHFMGWLDRFSNPRNALLFNNTASLNNTKHVNMSIWGRPPNSTGDNGTFNITGLSMWFCNQSLDWDWSGNSTDQMSIAYFYDTSPEMQEEYKKWLLVMDNDNIMNESLNQQVDRNDSHPDYDGFGTSVTSLEWDNMFRPDGSDGELLIVSLENISSTTIEMWVGDVNQGDGDMRQWNESNTNISAFLQASQFNGEPLNGSNVSIKVNVDCFGPPKGGAQCGDITNNITVIANSFNGSDAHPASYWNTPGNWTLGTDGRTYFTVIPPQTGWPEGIGGAEIRIALTVNDANIGKTDTFNINLHKESDMGPPGGGP